MTAVDSTLNKDFASVPLTSATATIAGTIRTITTTLNTFCTSYTPIKPTSNLLEDTTVIQNTYMYYSLTGFCEVMGTILTYKLTKIDGSVLDDWMIFNSATLILQGLVPLPKEDY